MSEIYSTPQEELLEAISNISDESVLFEDWFVKGFPIDDSFLEIFDVPHIDWDEIAPKSKQSRPYRELYRIMSRLYGDEFRKKEYNGHISIKDVEKDGSWKLIPELARALKLRVEAEFTERDKKKS